MKVKTALLAGAAALAPAISFAADLPSMKSAPVQYVRICDAYGRGFFYIPGTQTCLRLGGYVRAEYSWLQVKNAYNATNNVSNPGFNNAGAFGFARNATFTNKNGTDSLGWEMRGVFDVDARTQTGFGTVQTFMRLRLTSASGLYGTGYNTANYAASNAFGVTLIRAFVRFAGFTFGRSASIFNFESYDQYASHRRPGFANGTKQLAYTATFGGGFSATLGIEDRADFNAARTASALGACTVIAPLPPGIVACPAGIANSSIPTFAVSTSGTGPQRTPAITGNIRVDQDWGSFQASAIAIENTANITNPVGLGVVNANGPLIRKWGYAVGMGLKVKLPMLAAGDEFMITATAGKGAMDTVSNFSTSAITSDLGHILMGLTRTDMNMTVFGTGANGIRAELTRAWAVSGMFRHNWTPTLASFFGASYLSVTPGAVSRATDWQLGGLGKANTWTLSKALIWYPIQGFEIGAEVAYYKLNQTVPGNVGGAPSLLSNAATNACLGAVATCAVTATRFQVNPNAWRFVARAERRF